MDFLNLAKERYSCRKLTDRPVEQEKIDAILEAAHVAPTAANLQPYHVWVLKSEEAVQAMHQVTPCIFGAKLFFVVGGDRSTAWVRGYDKANFADVDATIVATQMMLQIQALGLGTTWVGHFDAPKLQSIYPQMAGYDLVAVFPVGYPDKDAAPSENHFKKKALNEVVDVL